MIQNVTPFYSHHVDLKRALLYFYTYQQLIVIATYNSD